MPKSIAIVGHSHAVALQHGYESDPHCLGIDRPFVHPPMPVSEEYWTWIEEKCRESVIGLVWNGNEHNARYLIRPTPAFDVVVEGGEREYHPDDILVPEEMIRAEFGPTNQQLDDALERLTKIPAARVLLLGTPPPHPDTEGMRERLKRSPHFIKLANDNAFSLDDVPLSSPSLRKALWGIVQTMRQETALRFSIPFIAVPPEACGDDGCLRADLRPMDATHANAEYGKLMLRSVGSWISENLDV